MLSRVDQKDVSGQTETRYFEVDMGRWVRMFCHLKFGAEVRDDELEIGSFILTSF